MDSYPLHLSFPQGILITTSGLLFYSLLRVTYNIFFHPLSRFPGPRGAACTRWWLAYMELVRGVSLSTIRAELHQQYGTVLDQHGPLLIASLTFASAAGDIIRIAPNEVTSTR